MNENLPDWASAVSPIPSQGNINSTPQNSPSSETLPSWATPVNPSSASTDKPMGWLPTVTGMIGGLLPTDIFPGASAVTGGAFQGGGEALRELLTGSKFDPAEITSQTGQGALYNTLPGGELVSRLLGKVGVNLGTKVVASGAKRFAGGALAGGGSQVLENATNSQPLMQDVVPHALQSGALNTAFAAGLSGLGKLGTHLGVGVPSDIRDVVETQPKALQNQLEQQAQDKVQSKLQEFQHSVLTPKYTELGMSSGILNPNDMGEVSSLNAALEKAKSSGKITEAALQAILKREDLQVPGGDIITKLKNIVASHPPGPETEQANFLINNFEKQLTKSALDEAALSTTVPSVKQSTFPSIPNDSNLVEGERVNAMKILNRKTGRLNTVPPPKTTATVAHPGSATDTIDWAATPTATESQLNDIKNGKYPISLSKINDFNRESLKPRYYDSPLMENLYKTVQTYIENQSTKPLEVGNLNKTAHGFSVIQNSIDKHLNGNGSLFSKYSPDEFNKLKDTEGIAKQVETSKNQQIPSLENLKTGGTAAAMALGALGGRGAGLGGLVGGGWGARFLAQRLENTRLKSPEQKLDFARSLENMYAKTQKPLLPKIMNKQIPASQSILQALQQLGARL